MKKKCNKKNNENKMKGIINKKDEKDYKNKKNEINKRNSIINKRDEN